MSMQALKKESIIKKYVITVFIVIFILFIGLYYLKWKQVKQKEKFLQSYLVSTGTINLEMNDINEIEYVLIDAANASNNYFLYISYTENENIYNFEKELKPLIDKYNLYNNFYFLNITNIKKNISNYKSKIAKILKIDDKDLNKIPVILYFDDEKLENKIYSAKELEVILNSDN